MRVLVSTVALLVWFASQAHAGVELKIPEKFFRGDVLPDNSVQFIYTKPNLLDPEQANDTGWWNAVAKFKLLLATSDEFRMVYQTTKNDPDLQKTGVTYADWSRGTQDQKKIVRARMHEAIQHIVSKNHLQELLETTVVDEQKLVELSLALQTKKAINGQLLIKYCPGAVGNYSVNSEHPAFARFQRAIDEPKTSEQFQSAIISFSSYLDAHPTASVDERTAELNRLVAPVLARVQ